jgi:hypothetical protein
MEGWVSIEERADNKRDKWVLFSNGDIVLSSSGFFPPYFITHYLYMDDARYLLRCYNNKTLDKYFEESYASYESAVERAESAYIYGYKAEIDFRGRQIGSSSVLRGGISDVVFEIEILPIKKEKYFTPVEAADRICERFGDILVKDEFFTREISIMIIQEIIGAFSASEFEYNKDYGAPLNLDDLDYGRAFIKFWEDAIEYLKSQREI